MPYLDVILELEYGFWTGDAALYEQRLAEDALMVFADPVGILERDAIVRSIQDAPRWADVSIVAPRVRTLCRGVLLLTYQAIARREGDTVPYTARVTSIYRGSGESYRLAFHQQTPGPVDPVS